MKKYCLLIIVVLTGLNALAQSKSVRWGKYTKDELSMVSCSFEKEAEALILYENATLSYQYEKYVKNFRKRIKILSKEAVGLGVITIPFDPTNEKIPRIEGITTNQLRSNVVSTKLRSEGIIIKSINENLSEMIITMPEVRKGSIIEYRYEKKTVELLKPEDWFFQHKIPTVYSAYEHLEIPKDLAYQTVYQGELTTTKYRNVGLKFWELENIPSLPVNKDFLFNTSDYVEKIEFRSANGNDLTSWGGFIKQYIENGAVERAVGNQSLSVALLGDLGISQLENKFAKASAIYEYIQKKYPWSGEKNIYPSNTDKSNSATVNLKLFALIKALVPETYIVLISTPEHGRIHKSYPLLEPFDHVVVKTTFDGLTYFLDATDSFFSFGMLPYYSEGVEGLSFEQNGVWLKSSGLTQGKNTIYQQVVFEGQNLVKSYNIKWDVASSASYRKEIVSSGSDNYFKKPFGIPEVREIIDYSVENEKEVGKSLVTKFSYEFKDYIQSQEKLYFNPVEYIGLLENPFVEESRYYPVQYKNLPHIQLTTMLTIPVGYEVETLPKSVVSSLPEDYGKFTYKSGVSNGKIMIIIEFSIDKNNIPGYLYPALKNFYNVISDRCEAPVVFKKI